MSVSVKALFDLPESIHEILFVEKLSEAVDAPARTAANYVVTRPIANAFGDALGLVQAALTDRRSRAAYLHGSFGSGKSHFMAMLSLLLDGHEAAWAVPELHPLKERHPLVGARRILQLHFHMVGFESLEQAIFQRYLGWLKAHHPKAPVPGVFADERLFADARRLLEELGEGVFFGPMNAGAATDDEWGAFGGASSWNRERFERHAASTDPVEREQLFSALVATRFSSYAQESRQFVDLDTGLGVLGRHAKGLGYDAVVLFLDELVLWLASRASDAAWFHNEVQKLVKLVEAQDAAREVPFVSFIARQRDLAEMVGQNYVGLENKLVRDSLQWSEGRYKTISLEDRNLPAIAEKRLLRPKDAAAKQTLDESFEKLRKGAADPAWRTMLGALDAADFRRLYPFSPVLVDALVALSNALQRERTAIRLLTELLVEHIETLKLGDVVGVGDLYDVLAGGEGTADGVMRARFESAKNLYTYRLLPLLQRQHGTDSAEKCQRLRPEHPARIGCSNCPVASCRNDNRLVKTLIIAALVPEVPGLKDMTAARLLQLNHGTLRLPIPGTEGALVVKKLREWASEVGQLHLGVQADPTVSLQLEGVDLKPILEQASHLDSLGSRQRVLKDLLFEAMGVGKVADIGKDHRFSNWRGTDRLGHVRFGNVRKMSAEMLRCPPEHDWRFIIDYPFDEPGFGPHDDERVLDRFRDEEGGSWTLVWLPSFFSKAMSDMLGDLVILEHIVAQPSAYVGHLSVEHQQRARMDLVNLRTQKEARLVQALEQAYGLAQVREGDIDSGLAVERHLHVLRPGATIQAPLVASLATALDGFVAALLEARYPRHPKLAMKLTPQRVERLVEKFDAIVESERKQIAVDKALHDELRGTLGELGLVRMTETAAFLKEDGLLQEIEGQRQRDNIARPEVQEIRRFIDGSGKMGLQPEALDLLVRCYARWSARTFVVNGLPLTPKAGTQLPGHAVLEKPDLPSHERWAEALEKAGGALGVVMPGKALHADNLKRFEAELDRKVKDGLAGAKRLEKALVRRLQAFGGDDGVARLRTARSAVRLLEAVAGHKGREKVEAVAAWEAETSVKAVSKSFHAADAVAQALENELVFGAFGLVAAQAGSAGEELLERVRRCLRQDEVVEAAGPRLKALAEEAQGLLRAAEPLAVAPPKGGVAPAVMGAGVAVVAESTLRAEGKEAVLEALQAAFDKARKAAEAAAARGAEVRLSGSVIVTAEETQHGGKGG